MGFGHEDLTMITNKKLEKKQGLINSNKNAVYTDKKDRAKNIRLELDLLFENLNSDNFMNVGGVNPFQRDEEREDEEGVEIVYKTPQNKKNYNPHIDNTPINDPSDFVNKPEILKNPEEEKIREKEKKKKISTPFDIYDSDNEENPKNNQDKLDREKNDDLSPDLGGIRILTSEEKKKADEILEKSWKKADEFNPFYEDGECRSWDSSEDKVEKQGNGNFVLDCFSQLSEENEDAEGDVSQIRLSV